MQTQSDMNPGSEVDFEQVHHAHVMKYCENRCNHTCRLCGNAGSDTDGETPGVSRRQQRYRKRGTPKDKGSAMDTSRSPQRVLQFADSDRYEACLPLKPVRIPIDCSVLLLSDFSDFSDFGFEETSKIILFITHRMEDSAFLVRTRPAVWARALLVFLLACACSVFLNAG